MPVYHIDPLGELEDFHRKHQPELPGHFTRLPDLRSACQAILDGSKALGRWRTTALVDLFQAFADRLLEQHDTLMRQLSPAGLPFLVPFLSRSNLERLLAASFPGRTACLDGFTYVPEQGKTLRARPKGMVVHWIAGNVLVLGLISLIQGLLTRNANIVKIPSKEGLVLPRVFSLLAETVVQTTDGSRLSGNDLLKAVLFVYCESDDINAQTEISRLADVRVVWGGRDAVESISKLPRKPHAEDMIFGPKTSFAVLGKHALSRNNVNEVADQIAREASWFDQSACTSPHTVFVEEGGEISPRDFGRALAGGMERALKTIPRLGVTPAEAYSVVETRSRYRLTGEVFASSSSDWTVILSEEKGLAAPVQSRVVFVRPLAHLEDLPPLMDRSVQTVGLLLQENRKLPFAEKISLNGIDRITHLGQMHLFEHPWDGLFPLDRLVRWVCLG